MALYGNIARAAREAEVSDETGRKWMMLFDVQIRIEELRLEIAEHHITTRGQVITELARIAYADPRKLFNKADLKRLDQLPDDVAAAIDSIEVEEGFDKEGNPVSGLKIKSIAKKDKLKALDALGRHFNIFADHEKAGTGQVNILIMEKDARL